VISRVVKDSDVRYLVDTGPLVAVFNRGDAWHSWAAQTFAAIDESFWTSEAVVTKTGWNLGENSPAARELRTAVADGVINVLVAVTDGAERWEQLMAKYPRMDGGDGSLVLLSGRFPKARILTVDFRDFPVYRRFGREPLPWLMPERS
jgi:predicted nucleic acid-binding protein